MKLIIMEFKREFSGFLIIGFFKIKNLLSGIFLLVVE